MKKEKENDNSIQNFKNLNLKNRTLIFNI